MTADTRTVMTKKVSSFSSGKIGSAAPVEGPPHFFLNRALLRVNPALQLSPARICTICFYGLGTPLHLACCDVDSSKCPDTWPPLVLPGYVYIGHCMTRAIVFLVFCGRWNDDWLPLPPTSSISSHFIDLAGSFHSCTATVSGQLSKYCRKPAATSSLTVISSPCHLFTWFQFIMPQLWNIKPHLF